jgi:hypothetical protein
MATARPVPVLRSRGKEAVGGVGSAAARSSAYPAYHFFAARPQRRRRSECVVGEVSSARHRAC